MPVEQLYRGLGSESALKSNALNSLYKNSFGQSLRLVDTLSKLKGLTTGNMAITDALDTIKLTARTASYMTDNDEDLASKALGGMSDKLSLNSAFEIPYNAAGIDPNHINHNIKFVLSDLGQGDMPTPNDVQDMMNMAINGLSAINKNFKNLSIVIDKKYKKVGEMGKDSLLTFETYKKQFNCALSAQERTMSTVVKVTKNHIKDLLPYRDVKYEKIVPDILKAQVAQIKPSMLMNPSELQYLADNTTDKLEQVAINKAKEILNNAVDKGFDLDEIKNFITDSPTQISKMANSIADEAMGVPGFLLSVSEQLLIDIRDNVAKQIEGLVKEVKTLYAQAKALEEQIEELGANGADVADALSGGLVFFVKDEVSEWMEENGLLTPKK